MCLAPGCPLLHRAPTCQIPFLRHRNQSKTRQFAKTYEFEIHLVVEQHVLRLQVAMHDIFRLQERKCLDHLGRVYFDDWHVEFAIIVEQVSKVAILARFEHKIEVVLVL